jgi:NNP family nitrate/nitrite transporter-like MFS transporter
MMVVRDELGLTRSQIGWSIIASVAMTVIARLFIGWLCDRIGPRLAYTWLLILGSLPVILIGVTQFVIPLVFTLFVMVCGFSNALGWQLSMLATDVVCLLTGIAYYAFTQDAPDGNFIRGARQTGGGGWHCWHWRPSSMKTMC